MPLITLIRSKFRITRNIARERQRGMLKWVLSLRHTMVLVCAGIQSQNPSRYFRTNEQRVDRNA
jgi:hypothetical protein